MTSRENFLRFYRGEPYEFTPTSFDTVKFLPEMIPENVARGMVVQQHALDPAFYGGQGFFGIDWVYDPAAGGSIETVPLFRDLDDLIGWEEKIRFPDWDSFDWEGCRRENEQFLREHSDQLIGSTIFSGFFERLISFVGFENASIGMIDEDFQPIIHKLFDRLADSYIEYVRRLHRYFRVEIIELHDDWGTQRAPMLSAGLHREMIAPYIKKVVDGCHEIGVFYEQHCCGFVEPLIGSLVDTGADTWRGQPLNDKLKLVKQYGDRFKFAVTMQPLHPISDEEALRLARDFRRDYAGRDVWVFLHPILTPAQKKLIVDEIHRPNP